MWERHLRTVLILGVVLALLGAAFWKPISVAWSLREARVLLRERESGRAVSVLLDAHRRDPDHPEVNYLLARGFRRLGQFKRVVEHLDLAEGFGWPAELIRLEQLMGAAQAGQLNSSAPELYKFLSRGGDYGDEGPEVCEALVNGYFLSYQFGLAQPLLDEWQQAYPDDAQCYMFRGLFYENRSNPSKAVAEYRNYVIYEMPAGACSPPTATPGNSEHQAGLAIDFTQDGQILDSDAELFHWLEEHAEDYGLFNLPSEAWHWSTTGN